MEAYFLIWSDRWFRFLFVTGTVFLFGGVAGKSAIHMYRAVKAGNAFGASSKLGQLYKGGFERVMTPREAALILNLR